ncbi:MAG: hypothetical protein IJ747_00480 [Lachnospiraceae bacterium]|nr:hypothetical protein [Lachnospiraceae bacterium]
MDTIINLHCQNKSIPCCTYELGRHAYDDFQVLHITISEPFRKTLPRNPIARIAAWRQARRDGRAQRLLTRELREELDSQLDPVGDTILLLPQSLEEGHWIRTLLPIRPFAEYEELSWIRRLFPYAVHPDFVLLGSVGCVRQILEELSYRMKTLTWVVPDFTYREQAEEVAAFFYDEYGLAINLRFLKDGATYARLRSLEGSCTGPVNVLDLTGERLLPLFTLPAGSVWLDAYAFEEKEKRVRARNPKTQYRSLRTL